MCCNILPVPWFGSRKWPGSNSSTGNNLVAAEEGPGVQSEAGRRAGEADRPLRPSTNLLLLLLLPPMPPTKSRLPLLPKVRSEESAEEATEQLELEQTLPPRSSSLSRPLAASTASTKRLLLLPPFLFWPRRSPFLCSLSSRGWQDGDGVPPLLLDLLMSPLMPGILRDEVVQVDEAAEGDGDGARLEDDEEEEEGAGALVEALPFLEEGGGGGGLGGSAELFVPSPRKAWMISIALESF